MMQRHAALILAAGYSSRMGALKPLLPLSGKRVLESTVACFVDAGLNEVYVVLGHEAERIRESVSDVSAVRFVRNDRYDRGMFSSVQAGVVAMDAEVSAFLMMPADCPLVRPSTVREIIAASEQSQSGIVLPTYGGKGGHPLFVSMRYRNEIINANYLEGMRTFIQQHWAEVLSLPVDDPAILYDMDTPMQYEALMRRAAKSKEPG